MSEVKADYGTANIVRVRKDANYFAASNIPFNDERLSWEARGLMGYLLSKPDNWIVRMSDLQKKGPAGEAKMRRMLAELRKYGYINRIRISHSNGLFSWTTEIFEDPAQNTRNQSTSRGFSTSGLSTSGKVPDIVSTNLPSTKNIGAKSAPELTIENQIFTGASSVTIPPIDDFGSRRDLAAMQITHFGADLEPLALAAIDALKIVPAKRDIKGWALALREMKQAGVIPDNVRSAAKKLLDSGMTVADPFGLKKTAIALAAKKMQPQPEYNYVY